MNRMAHYIMVSASIIFMASATGCGNKVLNPKPADRYYDGIVAYAGSVALEVRVQPTSVDSDHPNYSNWVLLDATSSGGFSTASYYFHARPYVIEFRNANTQVIVRTVTVTPDNIHDDRTYEYLTELDWVYNYNSNQTAK